MKTSEYLDAAKAALEIESDGELGRKLEIDKRRVSDYRNNKHAFSNLHCRKIADATGLDFEMIVADMELATEKEEKNREVWRKRLVSLGGIAATITALLFAPVILKMTPEAGNASATTVSSGQTLYYVKFWQQITETAEAVRRELNTLFRRVFYADSPNAGITA